MITEHDLAGLPWGFKHLILNTVRNPRCTPDHILLLAEAVEESLTQVPPVSFYLTALQTAAAKLREAAPEFAKPNFRQT